MTQKIGIVCLCISVLIGIGLFIHSLATSAAFRRNTANALRKVGKFFGKHWVGTLTIIAFIVAIVNNDTTVEIFQLFGTIGIMVCGILLMLSSVFKVKGRWLNWLWRCGLASVCIVALASLLNRLPW